jgi:adenylylsulfate kinase-like enzyme
MIILLTGKSGSGKTTLGKAICERVENSCLLDGDDLRATVDKDLGFTKEDIAERCRRVGKYARFRESMGSSLVVITIIAPLLEPRLELKRRHNVIDFLIEQSGVEERDAKGLYKSGKAMPYEKGEHDFVVCVDGKTVSQCADYILEVLGF